MDAMASVLATEVFKSLQENAKFALDFKDELAILKTTLDLMTSFLSSNERQSKSEQSEHLRYLPELRKLIYEADDILTDCQIWEEYRTHGFCFAFSPHDLLFRCITGRNLKHVNSKMNRLSDKLSKFITSDQTKPNQERNVWQSRFITSQNYDPYEPIGLENDVQKIKGWLLRGKPQRIGFVGMGGLGKTTLARKIFHDKEVMDHFQDMVWVSVSRNFNCEHIMRVILKQLVKHDSRHDDESQLLYKIHQAIGNRTCLLVMDDVWDTVDVAWWNNLCPNDGINIYIIVTSRNEDVIRLMGVDISRIHKPPTLNMEQSWSLLMRFAFPSSKGECPNYQLEEIGKEILEKCDGLPLAIKTIGALLSARGHNLIEWKQVHNDLRHELIEKGRGDSISVMASLQLSYEDLPTHLKQCLLCFSVYPEDFEIRAERMVHWWVGEGLIQGRDTRTAIELGFDYLSQLVSKCLVEVVSRRVCLVEVVSRRGYDGRVYSCRMHDMVREMTIKITEEEAFCSFDGRGVQELRDHTRWLGFTSGINQKLLKNCLNLRSLIILTSNEDVMPFDMDMELPTSLRVLDLSQYQNSDNKSINIDAIRSLKRLAYINIHATILPSYIKKLRNLQILVVRGCCEIAASITELKKLIVLDLGSCNLRYFPRGLGNLKNLQELSGFKVVGKSNTESCQLHELQELKQLRVLRMSINVESKISKNELDVLSNLEKLKVLAVDAEDCTDKNVLDILNNLSPPPNLQELYLKRYSHDTMPDWINPICLSSLNYLCLEEGLVVDFLNNHHESPNDKGSKWKLVGLCLKHMPNLVLDWKKLEYEMPSLCYAEISYCFNLRNCPFPLNQLQVWRKGKNLINHG